MMADNQTTRITRTELEKLLNFVKLEMKSKMLNITGLLLSKLVVLLQITFKQNQEMQAKTIFRKNPQN